jgi:YD repeat-containing protein
MNRLTSATGMSFQWDANGNLVYMDDGSDEWDYTYDYENRLIKVLKNDAILNRYFYDTDGRRVKVVDGQGDSLIHIYTGLNVVYEKTVSSTTKHYYANGLHIAENRGGTRVLSPRTPR